MICTLLIYVELFTLRVARTYLVRGYDGKKVRRPILELINSSERQKLGIARCGGACRKAATSLV